ncbi:zinc finger, CCHC-type containing protein [Tanacetum coccineum]
MDRISNLPLSILETILCLLPYHEVVRTSTLSKEWRYHWTNVTKIVVIEDTRTLNRIKLLSGVSQALLMHKGPIHEVTLSIAKDDHWGFETVIRRIISHLSSKKAVKKLTVDFGSRGYHNSLPISLFLMSQLTDLYLNGYLCNDSTVASEPKVRLKRRKEEVGCVEDKQRMDAVKEKAIEAIMRYCDSLYFKENTIEEKLNGIQGPRQGIGNQTQGRGKYRSEGYTSDESDGTDNKPRRNGDKSQINCYKCGKLGHYAYECPSKKKEEVEALLVENDDEPALLRSEARLRIEDGRLGRVIRSKQSRVMRNDTEERLCEITKLAVKNDSSVTDQIENGVMPKMKTNKWALACLKKTNHEDLCNDSTVASEPKVRLKRKKEEVGCVEDKQRMDAVKEKAIEAIMRYCDSLYFKENTIEEKLNGIQGPRVPSKYEFESLIGFIEMVSEREIIDEYKELVKNHFGRMVQWFHKDYMEGLVV